MASHPLWRKTLLLSSVPATVRRLIAGLAIFLMAGSAVARAAFDPEPLREIESLIRRAIERENIPGAVVWIERNGESWHRAFGWKAVEPALEPMSEDTIFDVASLTKVTATTPAILRLVEQGKIDLAAPLDRYLPEFAGPEPRGLVTVRHLMTHTSGLPPGIGFDSLRPWTGYDEGIRRACLEPLRSPAGAAFVYSDINFILLGEVARRAGGRPLDELARSLVFEPLGMKDTGFRPDAALCGRIAPTTVDRGRAIRGVVHDPTSRRMGGVCGHAGLFSTAENLARYCRAWLHPEATESAGFLTAGSVAAATTRQTDAAMEDDRGLGWDRNSKFSSQRGAAFPVGGFGHTGWTGPSLWLDPASGSFVVFVSNRNHPTEAGTTGPLRGEIATLAAQAMGVGARAAGPRAPVLCGIDVLEQQGFSELQGLRLGLITNHTGRTRDGRATVDVLAKASGVQLKALFGPEHGIRGELDQARIADGRDTGTGLPVHSLYGENRAPTPKQLAELDALVFDIQDIGCRFYTYISTLTLAMEAAAKAGKKVIVLDRPNPIGGEAVQGPLREGPDSFTAAHRIPVRHGMTVGELAKMIASERGWKLDLKVIACQNWQRRQFFDETALPWVNPSPNMRSLTAALLYPGVGLLEFTNVSVGRGTDTPFQLFGAPWIDGQGFAAAVRAQAGPGFSIEPADFTPTASVFAGKACHGVRLDVVDREKADPLLLGSALATALVRLHPADFQTKALNKLLCSEASAADWAAGKPAAGVRQRWWPDERAFAARRQKFLIYR